MLLFVYSTLSGHCDPRTGNLLMVRSPSEKKGEQILEKGKVMQLTHLRSQRLQCNKIMFLGLNLSEPVALFYMVNSWVHFKRVRRTTLTI